MANEPEAPQPDKQELRARIMGMGNQSMRKSYYPVLQHRVDELERYKKLLNRAHEGILLLELPELRVSDANLTAGELLGVEPEALAGSILPELLPAATAEDLRLWLSNLTPGGVLNLQIVFPVELAVTECAPAETPEGERWLELGLSLIDAEDGQGGIVGIVRDVTQFYRQNEALKNSERKLHAIFDNSYQFTGILDRQGRVLAANQTSLQAIAATESEVLGRPFWDTPWWQEMPEEQRRLKESFRRCMSGETVRYHCLNASPNGKRVWLDFSLKPVFDDSHEIVMVIPEGRDITETRLLEEQLMQSQKMDSIGQLAGGVAHDFNNLLGGIIGSADLLTYLGTLNDEQTKLVKVILSAAGNAAELTNKLLAFARKEKAVSTAVDVHEILEEVRLLLERSIDKRIQIRLRLEAGRRQVVGDPSQLKSGFLNLGINARDAMTHGGRLEISTSCEDLDTSRCAGISADLLPGAYIVVQFRDTGCGISPENLGKIFEPFFTTKEVGKGTGLGLAAVYGMVKSHHGAVTVESQLGIGTSFTLYLPLEAEYTGVIGNQPEPLRTLRGGCVLVADDEQINRTTITLMLEKLGFTVLLAENGKEAVAHFRDNREKISAVLLDLVMPEMSGEDAFVEIRRIDPDAKILIMSGFTADMSVRRLQELGALGFIHKPFRFSDLAASLAKTEA